MSQSSHFLSCRQRVTTQQPPTTTTDRRHRSHNRPKLTIPATPFLHYQHSRFDPRQHKHDHGHSCKYTMNAQDGFERKGFHGGFSSRAAVEGSPVSARKLAASLWKLQLSGSIHNFGLKENEMLDLCYPERVMEEATRWDSKFLRVCSEARSSRNHMKRLNDHVHTTSVVAGVRAEVLHPRHCVHEVQTENWSSESKAEDWLRRLEEERISPQTQNVRAVADELNNELRREMKSRETLEILNSKLVIELAKTKSFVKRVRNDYLKERKARRVMGEVCIDLANKVEDKTKNKLAKIESIRFQEEVIEELRMLQMIGVWHEERVQIKMLDAKLALEHKFCQMNKLIDELETVLGQSRSGPIVDTLDLRTADLLIQKAKAIDIENAEEEFDDLPAESDELFDTIEAVERIPELFDNDWRLLTTSSASSISDYQLRSKGTLSGNSDKRHDEGEGDGSVAGRDCLRLNQLTQQNGGRFTVNTRQDSPDMIIKQLLEEDLSR